MAYIDSYSTILLGDIEPDDTVFRVFAQFFALRRVLQ